MYKKHKKLVVSITKSKVSALKKLTANFSVHYIICGTKSFDFTDQFQEQKQPLFVHTIFLREGYLGFLSKPSPNTILRHKFIRTNTAIMMKNIFQVHTTVVISVYHSN